MPGWAGAPDTSTRDEAFLLSDFVEENYHKQFTGALRDCVETGNFKYPTYCDNIYVSILRVQFRGICRQITICSGIGIFPEPFPERFGGYQDDGVVSGLIRICSSCFVSA
jgi:hypothetical protein